MFKKCRIPKIPSILLWLATPAISFWLLETLTHSVAKDMEFPLIALNLVFYYLLYGLLLVISKRSFVSLGLGSLLVMIIGLVDYYVIQFRSVPLYPWDILSVKTAMSVSDNYNYSLDKDARMLVLGFVLLIIIGIFTSWKLPFKNPQYHLLSVLSVVGLFVLYGTSVQMPTVHEAVGFYEYHFTPNAFYQMNGFAVSFISNMQYLDVSKPADYSMEKVQEILEPYIETNEKNEAGEVDSTYPNVIVIMNEAFSDPAVLGDFETNIDYMPFIRSLSENTVKGRLMVSVKGGNTANSEYEFLTGNSMAFLPSGSVPYQQYIRGEMPSVASQLKNLGYETFSIHPYRANGWNRNKVYEYFGFDTSYFKESFTGAPILREYTTDLATYQKIVDIYTAKTPGQPMFVFDVTMQNHSSYSKEYDNFTPDVEVLGSNSSAKLLERYLSLIKVSDEAFSQLVGYFSQVDEPTVILMFGDHQPADWVVSPIYRMNGVEDTNSWSESMERYEVPFVLWANYDIDEEAVGQEISYDFSKYDILSVNYLSTVLFEAAGLPMSPFQQYMKDIMKDYPVLTANMFLDNEGVYFGVNMAQSLPEKLKDYAILNYNLLFDAKHRKDEWYAVYPYGGYSSGSSSR